MKQEQNLTPPETPKGSWVYRRNDLPQTPSRPAIFVVC